MPSDVFPTVPSNKPDGASEYQGGFYEDGTISKNLVVKFENVDVKYQELEVVALYYESSASIFKASVVGQIPITNDVVEFTYTGPDTENLINLTREELQKIVVSYTHAKCIEQKDNTLFLSNLRDDRVGLSKDLQEIANKVKVKYRIDNIQFSGRGDDLSTSSLIFDEVAPPFKNSSFSIILPMNEIVDPTTGSVLATYQLNKLGESAGGSITIANNALIVDLDTITIAAPTTPPYTGSQVAIVLTARPLGTTLTTGEFEIGANANDTAQNILNTINALTTVTEFIANPTANNIISLTWSSIDVNVNSTAITSSNTAGITTTNFTGATVTPVTVVPISINLINGQASTEVELTFANPINVGDELCVLPPGINNVPDPTVTPLPNVETYTTNSAGSGLIVVSTQPSSAAGATQVAGFTDYTNEFLTATKKGYRRGEVYSLGFKILWKDGTFSPAFHIPGEKDYVTNSGVNAPTGVGNVWPTQNIGDGVGTGRIGTYVSQDVYSAKQNYPGDQSGDDLTEVGPTGFTRNIRHHYMPTLESEPHFTQDVNGVEFIRVLGLDFEFTQVIPSIILDEADEIIFLRERRNTDNNKSIYAQGLVHKSMLTADSFNNDGEVDGFNESTQPAIPGDSNFGMIRSNYTITELPFFNLNFGVFGLSSYESNDARVYNGMCNSFRSNGSNSAALTGYSNGRRMETQAICDQVMFHSPESNLLSGFKLNADNIKNYTLSQELIIGGKFNQVMFRQDLQYYETASLFFEYYLEEFAFADLFCNYTKIDISLPISHSNNDRIIEDARYLPPDTRHNPSLDPDNPALKTRTDFNGGGLQLLLDDNVYSTMDNAKDPFDHKCSIAMKNDWNPGNISSGKKGRSYFGSINYTDATAFTGPSNPFRPTTNKYSGANATALTPYNKIDNKRTLYNIKVTNVKQYGQISKASYIPIKRTPIKDISGNFITTYQSVYGGDTFITKYAFNSGIILRYDPFKDTGKDPINSASATNTQRPGGYISSKGAKVNGWDFRTCTYYFVESNINTHYRHAPDDDTKQNYFPNEKDLVVLLNDSLPPLGRVQAYNTQYSFENNVIESFLIASASQVIADFENRTIYSEKAANDDTLDTYRSFLQSDYYDLPSETGPIWDTFVDYDTLFMHTPKSLWKTFAEPAATLSGSNISDVVLGTASLFSRPSTQIMEAEGGYGGTLSQFGGIHTKIGYVFVDLLQGKVFAISTSKKTGMFLNEISKEGMSTFMHKNLPLGITSFNNGVDLSNVTTKKAHLIDNPYIGIGITGGYDYKLDRYFLVKFPFNIYPGFTVSYVKDLKNWFSFHDYAPNVIIPYDNRTLFVTKKSLTTITSGIFHEMNTGLKGSYFGTVYNSEIEYVVSSKERAAVFNTMNINSTSTDRTTGIKNKDDNFNEMRVHTDRSNTDFYDLVPNNVFGTTLTPGQVFIKYRNDEYRLAIPRDAVTDNSNDIFDSTNLNKTNTAIRERIKGMYAIFKLKYYNTNNLKFVLNDIKTIFINNFR